MDDLIAGTGVSYRALANGSFMENVLRQIASITDRGIVYANVPGDLKTSTVATRDIAAAGAALLLDRSWSGTGEVPLLGPEDLSFNEMAQIMSDVLGKAVRFESMSDETLKAAMLAGGRSEAITQAVIDMTAAVRNGIYSNEPQSGRSSTPTTFRQWCRQVLRPAIRGG